MSQVPSRNQPCPCGSGKKFKHCHGGANSDYEEMISRGAVEAQRQAAIHRLQTERQQGRGRGIISAEVDGTRIVIVGNHECLGKWKTFPDFLYAYIVDVLGCDWFQFEAAKTSDARHPILKWNERLMALSKVQRAEPGQIMQTRMTGAVNAYLTLAYDLYTLAHNADQTHTAGIRDRLLHRLKHRDQFVVLDMRSALLPCFCGQDSI